MSKRQIREHVKNQLALVSQPDFDDKCQKMAEQLFQLSLWKEAKTIAITISNAREIHTANIIEEAWKSNKKVAIPKCNPSDHSMSFRYFDSYKQLESVYYGLLEPKVECTEVASKESLDLIIVPGIAFDERGYRIGYGGGYYDRYLMDYSGPTISMLLTEQMVPSVPSDAFDIPVQYLITPNGVQLIHE